MNTKQTPTTETSAFTQIAQQIERIALWMAISTAISSVTTRISDS